ALAGILTATTFVRVLGGELGTDHAAAGRLTFRLLSLRHLRFDIRPRSQNQKLLTSTLSAICRATGSATTPTRAISRKAIMPSVKAMLIALSMTKLRFSFSSSS